MPSPSTLLKHPRVDRRTAIQVGAIGWMNLGLHHVRALCNEDAPNGSGKSVIYIFLSGGLAQHDSFDMKPMAADDVRGEFQPIATRTPGIQICEHLPMLAQRSHLWALCRSLTHPWNEHSQGHHIMLTGRSQLPQGFNASRPQGSDWPSIAAIANAATRPHHHLPSGVVLPDRNVHNTGRVIPGQFGGIMGEHRNPWFIEAAPFHPRSYGAFPEYQFDHQERGDADQRQFEIPSLELPRGLTRPRLKNRMQLARELAHQRRRLDEAAATQSFDRYRQGVISLLTDRRVQEALDVTHAEERVQERYGRNSFGWSLLMAKRLVAAGVNLVQVNLGNNETWDTHGNAFPHLKDNLFPPTDRAVSALLDDLEAEGLLDETLIVMASEFGRTPRITLLPEHYKLPGRDHWGAVQSIFLAGGGIKGGNVVGASDRLGAYPADSPQRPENMAATIYRALGLPPTAVWHDELERPHPIYHAEPISGLS